MFARWFERRQVRRLPYLFSVAPAGYTVTGLGPGLTPPSLEGFPPTHELLERCWLRALDAMETILGQRPYLLGERFTLADASAYGQLSMNLTDTAAARRLRQHAPRTLAWLCGIRERRHTRSSGTLSLHGDLVALLQVFLDTFAPLMSANEAAYERHRRSGTSEFNEKAFDRRLALFDTELLGQSCRGVVKTFQVKVWRDLRRQWRALDVAARGEVEAFCPDADWDSLFEEPAGFHEERAASSMRA